MSRIVTGSDVWPAIEDLLRGSRRKVVATAFLGADAPDLLSALEEGDLLVCNASKRTLKAGATNPAALKGFLDAGVTVLSHQRLHAKIYVGDQAAFVGSANASASSVHRQLEAGVVVTGAAQLRQLEVFVRELADDPFDVTQVNGAYVEWAEGEFRPARQDGPLSGGPRGTHKLIICTYGDEEPPSVTAAAARQLPQLPEDAVANAGTVGYSWGSEKQWRLDDRCVWLEREHDTDPEKWIAEPPAVCFAAKPVGGSSKQWVYWWRTPAGTEKTWGQLRQDVLCRTGHRLELDAVTAVAGVVDTVYRLYGVSRGTGGMLDPE